MKEEAKEDLKTTISGTVAAVAGALTTIPGPHIPIAAAVAAIAGSLFAFWTKTKEKPKEKRKIGTE